MRVSSVKGQTEELESRKNPTKKLGAKNFVSQPALALA